MSEQASEIFAPAPFVDSEPNLWHTPTLAEVVGMLYPQYAGCEVYGQEGFLEVHYGPAVYPRPHHVFVVIRADNEYRALEVHENCFRADGPPPHPENMITPEEAEREVFEETYTVLPSGRAIVCQLTLAMGHTEEGISRVIDGENFNLKTGRMAARREAMKGVYRYLAQRKREFVGKRAHTQD